MSEPRGAASLAKLREVLHLPEPQLPQLRRAGQAGPDRLWSARMPSALRDRRVSTWFLPCSCRCCGPVLAQCEVEPSHSAKGPGHGGEGLVPVRQPLFQSGLLGSFLGPVN